MAKQDVSAERLKEVTDEIVSQLRRVVIGQDRAMQHVLTAFFAGGHCMITGVPGVGKTLLIASLARIMDLSFRRIQFTPDLMPSDITGTEILEEDMSTGRREMRFVRGPVFANIVMADEINRTPPKTQAALLETMQERQVTIGGKTYPLEQPTFVLATQIPFEQEGTYPLPEAQQDRFMFNVMMDYLGEDDEVAVIKASTGYAEVELKPLVSKQALLAFQELILKVQVPPSLVEYTVDLVVSSRPGNPTAPDFIKEYVAWGAGLRASQYITLGAKSLAAMSGRMTAQPEDVQAVVAPVLRHRIGLSFRADVDKVTVEDVIVRLLESMPVPVAAH
ncbi:MAG: AAA family ATPase [Phycisphaerae bacterium SM23_33]|nr:MAG: AAA family ATPase [Phycisphaerae bacterium SM23_33]